MSDSNLDNTGFFNQVTATLDYKAETVNTLISIEGSLASATNNKVELLVHSETPTRITYKISIPVKYEVTSNTSDLYFQDGYAYFTVSK